MNIIKKIFLTVTSLLLVANMYSQEAKFSFGGKVGMNLSNVDMEYIDTDAKVGYQLGIVAEYNLQKDFFLRSGLEINSKGFKSDLITEGDINGDGIFGDYGTIKSSWNMVYLQLPLMVGYKVGVTDDFKVNFAVGGYLSYGIGGKTTSRFDGFLNSPSGQFKHFSEQYRDNTFSDDLLKRFEVGLIGGIGAEFKLFTFNLGYEYGLSNISQAAVDIHNRNAFFTIGYRFF